MSDIATDYTQIEVYETDTIETVAARLVASAPASTVFEGIEIRVETGQEPATIVKHFKHAISQTIANPIGKFAFSTVQVIAVESPGPGGKIDPQREIKKPEVGKLYILWERRADGSVGTVAVVMPSREKAGPVVNLSAAGIRLEVATGPLVTALGSLLVEHAFRYEASEARLDALELRLAALLAKTTQS